jgi:hypothetical protein
VPTKKTAAVFNLFCDVYKADLQGVHLIFLGFALKDLGKMAEAYEAFCELERADSDTTAGPLVKCIVSGKLRTKCRINSSPNEAGTYKSNKQFRVTEPTYCVYE